MVVLETADISQVLKQMKLGVVREIQHHPRSQGHLVKVSTDRFTNNKMAKLMT